jgi:hypothetical protein
MRNIVQDSVAIVVLGLILLASIYFYQFVPPYLSSIEKFIISMVPVSIVLLILFIVLY